ncbi:hypothetical protein Taro_005858, partial [Colocasia esculenta]|nr:hypothetical protein [Colocasia esculenta]
LAVSSSMGLVGLASWAVFSGFRSAGSLEVPGAGTQLLFHVSRDDTWLFLPNLMEVCAEGCFRIVFDSAGSAGVMFGLSQVVVEAFLCFRYFVVLCSSLVREAHPLLSSGRDSLSQEFVAGRSWWWLVRRASSDPWVAARPSRSLAGVWEIDLLALKKIVEEIFVNLSDKFSTTIFRNNEGCEDMMDHLMKGWKGVGIQFSNGFEGIIRLLSD